MRENLDFPQNLTSCHTALRDGFRKNIELQNRNLLCPILFWSTTVHHKNQEH
jgi:hypothetical protein